jgi:hypothetical protein
MNLGLNVDVNVDVNSGVVVYAQGITRATIARWFFITVMVSTICDEFIEFFKACYTCFIFRFTETFDYSCSAGRSCWNYCFFEGQEVKHQLHIDYFVFLIYMDMMMILMM